MTVLASCKKLSKLDVLPTVKNKGGLIGKLLVRKPLCELELMYFPYYKVTLDVYIEARKLPFMPKKKLNTTIEVLVSGTTGSASIIQGFPKLERIETKNLIETIVSEEEVIRKATKCADRYVIRSARTFSIVKDVKLELFYRPYWVAFYGEEIVGEKAYYLPIQADGYKVTRTM